MSTKIVMIHGRAQASDPQTAQDPTKLAAYVENKKRQFLAGLAKGLVLANCPPIDPADVVFPFYGNVFQHDITTYEAQGGTPPSLEVAIAPTQGDEDADGGASDTTRQLSELQAGLLHDMVTRLDYSAEREVSYQDSEEFKLSDLSNVLSVPYVTGALQFLSRKTGVPATIIEHHLSDVAYYIGQPDMRTAVLDVVRQKVDTLSADDDLIIISHSLGTVVAFDALAGPDDVLGNRAVKLLVTAGSPLGLNLVKSRLLGQADGQPRRVPATLPHEKSAWVNAYDVTDIVALIHPLAPEFQHDPPDQINDQRTFNPTYPHAIIDYLADPDVAAPISDAYRRRR